MPAKRFVYVLVGTLLLAGCGSNLSVSAEDAGVDAGTTPDGGTVADGGVDAGMDAGTDAGTDGGMDGGTDGGTPVVAPDIPGLSGPVEVYFDDHGVFNAKCQTDEDCAAALGYFHARSRFFQMDLRRRLPTGRLTQVAGSLALDVSATNRQLFSKRDGTPLEQAVEAGLSPKTRGLFEAYARGVNAWLDDLQAGRNGARLPAEASFPLLHYTPASIPRWTVQDSLATILVLVEQLTNSGDADIAAGMERAAFADSSDPKLQAVMAKDLFGLTPSVNSPTLPHGYMAPAPRPGPKAKGHAAERHQPAALKRAPRDMRRALREARAALEEAGLTGPGADQTIGSNNWVVGPTRSANGHALLSNDPHLTLSNPAIWYLANLDSKTHGTGAIHAAGVSFAGLPFIIIGHNERIAWGATTTYFDQADVYMETLSPDKKGVMFEGHEVPFIEVPHDFELPDGTTVSKTLRFVPHHGPVLSVDEDAGTAVSLRWTGQDFTTDAEFPYAMMTANDIGEARAALENITTIGQNWVVIDRSGNIGWFPYNKVPTRPWAANADGLRPWMPVVGDGSAEWGPPYSYAELPQAMNPGEGFIATANNDMTGQLADGDPLNDGVPYFQAGVANGFRHARIVELLEASDQQTAATMLSTVGDTLVVMGRMLTPKILEVADGAGVTLTPAAQDIVGLLRAWQYTCPTGLDGIEPDAPALTDPDVLREAAGCSAFHAAIFALRKDTFADEVAAAGLTGSANWSALVFSLTDPAKLAAGDVYWDDVSTPATETKADIVAKALDEAGQNLSGLFTPFAATGPSDYLWGRVHTLTLKADLLSMFGSTFDNGPWAAPGGLFTVNVASPSDWPKSYAYGHGPSTRFICEELPTTGPSCTIQLPGGQDHFRDSPHYDDLLKRWLVNQPIPLPFDIDQAAANAAETITVSATP